MTNQPTDPVAAFNTELKKVAADFLHQLPEDREVLRTALRLVAPHLQVLKNLNARGAADQSVDAIVTHLAVGIALVSVAIDQKEEIVLAAKQLGRGEVAKAATV